ncbi:TNF-receptor-associated factor-like isoform X2 [Lycorma delicatula]
MEINDKALGYDTEDKLLIKCYFCGEILPNKLLQNHITHCQSVLDKCPQNCGAYITRQQKHFHITSQCSETIINKNTDASLQNKKNSCTCCEYCCKNITDMESELKVIQLRIDDEKRNRLKFEYTWLTELSKLHERTQKIDDWREGMFSVLSTIQKSIFHEEQIRYNEVSEIRGKFNNIASVLQSFETYMNELNEIMNKMQSYCLSKSDEIVEQFDDWRSKQENRLASLHNLNTELEKLQVEHINRSRSMLNLLDLNEIIIENQEQCSEQVKSCGKDIETFKEFLNEENYMISKIWYEQLEQFNNFKKDYDKNEDTIKELLSWQKSIKRKLSKFENSLKSEVAAESIFNEYKNSFLLHSSDIPIYSNGHLLWCISDFEEQFEESKLTSVVLESPSFYTSEYGYKLQMKLYPNGLGQWKGRHMIISLHVLDSEWDLLLEWPFKMNATVLLKDQSSDLGQVKDLIKCFGNNVVHKNNESTKTLQMFVPHRSLKENGYINNNTVILEAKVKIINDFNT